MENMQLIGAVDLGLLGILHVAHGPDSALDDVDRMGEHAATWEKVVRKLRVRMMPPPGSPRR